MTPAEEARQNLLGFYWSALCLIPGLDIETRLKAFEEALAALCEAIREEERHIGHRDKD